MRGLILWCEAGAERVAPPRQFPTPEEQIVGLLAEARRQGKSFDEAWDAVVDGGGRKVFTNTPQPPALALRWPSDMTMRQDSQKAILGSRDSFRRAYCREPPTPGDRAVVTLLDMLGERESDAPAAFHFSRSAPRPRLPVPRRRQAA
jgi:hypothetical protein